MKMNQHIVLMSQKNIEEYLMEFLLAKVKYIVY